jgi:Skp family chaperone for outer membrane proteins
MRRRAVLALALALAGAGPAPAQTGSAAAMPVLVIRQDRLFEATQFGRAAEARLEAASAALIAENARIEAELEAEERALTDRRAVLPPAEFRPLAEAFDARVERIRTEQDAKLRELNRSQEADRKRFLEAVLPVLADLMREKGALVILDQQTVFLSLDSIDITDEAVARIDAAIGDGTSLPP